MKPRVLIAEDHRVVAEGFKAILERDYSVVAVVADGHMLVESARELRPDIILVDISMPRLNGLEAVRRLRSDKLRAKVIFLTGSPEVTVAVQAFRAGATAYVLKASAGEELLTAIDAALKGQTYITPLIASEVLQKLMAGEGADDDPLADLTSREREVLQLLAEGRNAKEAAAVLSVSSRTVEFHKSNIMDKTGLRSTAELARFAEKHGLVGD